MERCVDEEGSGSAESRWILKTKETAENGGGGSGGDGGKESEDGVREKKKDG